MLPAKLYGFYPVLAIRAQDSRPGQVADQVELARQSGLEGLSARASMAIGRVGRGEGARRRSGAMLHRLQPCNGLLHRTQPTSWKCSSKVYPSAALKGFTHGGVRTLKRAVHA